MQITLNLYSESLGNYGHKLHKHTQTVSCCYLAIYFAPLRHWISGRVEALAGKEAAKSLWYLAQLRGPAGLAACVTVFAYGIQAFTVSLLGRWAGGGLIIALTCAHRSNRTYQ